MPLVSQKCRYALRAIFELAKHDPKRPIKIGLIASNQAIPSGFLENILGLLKQAGLVASVRGRQGGYKLIPSPDRIRVGDVIRAAEGHNPEFNCLEDGIDCPLGPNCVFFEIWRSANQALVDVYNSFTIQDLVDRERSQTGTLDYVI